MAEAICRVQLDASNVRRLLETREAHVTLRHEMAYMMSARGGPRLGHPWPSKDRKYSTRWDRTIDTNTS